jgi:TolB-like protein/Tfp pilus assembly protein PilF
MSKTKEITPPVAARDAAGPPQIDERYRIEKEIGRGGMGRVFIAHDRKLGRDVAIKVLASGMHGEEALRRFEQEARATCALNHANILDVHDIGTHEGNPYIVSELLHGITLRKRFRQGPLTAQEASGYALQLAQGLSAAHEKGIVHRDLKPENLFITEEDRLKILDFGIAKLVLPRTPGTGETLPSPQPRTETGAILGTVGYMSPEQVRGQPADRRSDVFSFGTIFYEMLAGRSPFERDTAVETGCAILNDDPLPLPAGVPASLTRTVQRCLAKRPEDRFQSGRELRDVLAAAEAANEALASAGQTAPAAQAYGRKGTRLALLLVGIGVLAAAVGLILLVRGIAKPAASVPAADQAAPSIAVLPFADMSPGKDQQYFSDGIAEEILNTLAQVEGLRVIGRTSSFSFKGKSEDLRAIGEKLNATNLLEGSVRKSGARVRITAQLVEAAGGSHLWSREFDRELTDVFALQDEIATAVVEALKIKLLPGQVPATKEHRTADPEAHNQYLLGRLFLSRGSPDGFGRAAQAFEKAVALDPDYAAAWAALADGLFWAADQDPVRNPTAQAWPRALAAAEKAIALAPNLADGYAVRGFLRTSVLKDWSGARADLERALAISPGDAGILAKHAWLLSTLGQLQEAIALLRKGLTLDPLAADRWWWLSGFYLGTGQLDLAESAARKSLEISLEQGYGARNLGFAYLLGHRLGEARAAFRIAGTASQDAYRLMGDALVEYELGHPKKSQRALDELLGKPFASDVAYQIAQVYAWRGEADKAFEWLGRAYDFHDPGLAYLKYDPFLRSLRGDPRYTAFLRKMKLPVD